MQDFFRCEEGYEGQAAAMAHEAGKKLVKDMHYEARIQAMIQYHAEFLAERITKRVARTMSLTSEQYMKVNIEHQYLFFLRLFALNFIFLYVIYLMT